MITSNAYFDTLTCLKTPKSTYFRQMFYKRNERCTIERVVDQNCPDFPECIAFPHMSCEITAERLSRMERNLLENIPIQECKIKIKSVGLHVKFMISLLLGINSLPVGSVYLANCLYLLVRGQCHSAQ